ncbi:hypothetical protein FACS1894184_20850 [Clostridia bacterium]|nr:hypothetical protein FACS1894184_20850 [Clostridia bacterium]
MTTNQTAQTLAAQFPIGSIAKYCLDDLEITVKIRGYHPDGAYLIVSGHGLRDVEYGRFCCDADELTRLGGSPTVTFHKDGLVGFIE